MHYLRMPQNVGNLKLLRLRILTSQLYGTYIGDYTGTKGGFRNSTVEVTISGGKITKITIRKGAIDKNGNPTELSGGLTIYDLFKKVMEKESLQVDAISGATLTSKSHLKALENALKQAK